ncbi:hypothetical protein D3C75_950120 [compost metagenome]
MLSGTLRKCLIGPLDNTLRTNVNPAARCHLPVHGQPFLVQLVKGVPVGPGRNQIGIRQQNTRGVRMGTEDGHRFAGLNQQRFIVRKRGQRLDYCVIASPVAGRFTNAAIDNQLPGMLCHLGVQIVHQHAQRGFLHPALGIQLAASRRTADSLLVMAHMG